MQTRASNSKAHPGTKAVEALRVHRPKEVIQKEKAEKRVKEDAKEEKRLANEVCKEAGKKLLGQLEAEVAAEAEEGKLKYPRQQAQAKSFKCT
jgi:hypothetical protein